MNFSWHLLYEQLQANPQMLEEETTEELLALSSQSELPVTNEEKNAQKENIAIKQLQHILGNAGFQKLVAQRRNFMVSNSANEKPEKKPQIPLHEQPEMLAEVAPRPDNLSPVDSSAPVQQLENNTGEKEAALSTSVSSTHEKSNEGNNLMSADPVQLMRTLLQQFTAFLPEPSLPVWKALADLYELLSANEQANTVSFITMQFQLLTVDQQKIFVALLLSLPAGTGKSAFVAALSNKLFSLVSAAAETSPPEVAEE